MAAALSEACGRAADVVARNGGESELQPTLAERGRVTLVPTVDADPTEVQNIADHLLDQAKADVVFDL